MFENLTNFSKLVRGAGQIMPRIQKMKETLAREQVEAKSSLGHVTVHLTGAGIVTRVEIDSALANVESKSSIELEMIEAMNSAIQQAKGLHLKAVREVVNEMGIPGIDRILEQLAE